MAECLDGGDCEVFVASFLESYGITKKSHTATFSTKADAIYPYFLECVEGFDEFLKGRSSPRERHLYEGAEHRFDRDRNTANDVVANSAWVPTEAFF